MMKQCNVLNDELFRSRIAIDPISGCWIWQRCRGRDGYGTIKFAKKMCRAHRLSWQHHYGPIPKNKFVLHTCDNPPCINPSHLFLGTNMDNARDKIVKGRGADLKGEMNGFAKLTATDVLAIRRDMRLQREIAADYGIGQPNVSGIKNRKSWAHV